MSWSMEVRVDKAVEFRVIRLSFIERDSVLYCVSIWL